MVTPRAKQKQTELSNMPPKDEIFIQGELILNIRRQMQDKKIELLEEGVKLIGMMRERKKYYIMVDGIKISVKDIDAKEVLQFTENG